MWVISTEQRSESRTEIWLHLPLPTGEEGWQLVKPIKGDSLHTSFNLQTSEGKYYDHFREEETEVT